MIDLTFLTSLRKVLPFLVVTTKVLVQGNRRKYKVEMLRSSTNKNEKDFKVCYGPLICFSTRGLKILLYKHII